MNSGPPEGLDKDKLSTKQEALKRRLAEEHYTALYREWAESIDADKNPQKYQEVLEKGLEYEPKNRMLNTLLVDFYEARAEDLIEQGKKAEAAEMLDKISDLYTMSDRRSAATERATRLREELFLEKATAALEEAKKKLIEEERWIAEEEAVLFTIEAEVDRRLEDEQARKVALVQLSKAVNDFVRQVAQLEEDTPMGLAFKLEGVEILEEENRRGTYTLKASFPAETLIAYGLAARKRAQAEADEEKKGDGAEGGEAKEDGEAKKEGGGEAAEGEAAEGEAAEGEGAGAAKEGGAGAGEGGE